MSSYPPSAPPSAPRAYTSWLPAPLSSLAGAAAFGYRHLSTLAAGWLYYRDNLVPGRLALLPLSEFYAKAKDCVPNEFRAGDEGAEGLLALAPGKPIAGIKVPAVPPGVFWSLSLFDPWGCCLASLSSRTHGNGGAVVVVVGTRTVGKGRAEAMKDGVKVVETDNDLVWCEARMVAADVEGGEVETGPLEVLEWPGGLEGLVRVEQDLQARLGMYKAGAKLWDGGLIEGDGDGVVGLSKEWREHKLEEWEAAARVLRHCTIPGADPFSPSDSPLHEPALLELATLRMLLPPPTLPLPSNPPALQLPEEKLLVRLADAAYKADHLLEEYAGIRGDAWLGAVKKEAGWESSPAPLDPRRMDAGTFDLLERALRARRGVLADPERVWWTCREDATGSPLDGSNAYSVAFAEPECGDGGFWVLSVRTAEGTVSELAGTAAKRAYPSQLVAVAVGGAEGGKGDAENYLAAGPGAFELRMDVYGPRGEAGEWVPAAVLRSA